MEICPDFKELLALLNAHEVEYVIVGAHALGYFGVPRYTNDLDILVKPSVTNGQRIVAALAAFGVRSLGFTAEDFAEEDSIVQLGVPPVRIDLITSVTGVTWEEIYEGKEAGKFGGIAVFYIGKKEFVQNKRATGRPKDLGDISVIGEA
jgi:hypothetical protein